MNETKGKLIKEKKIQITNIRNDRGDITQILRQLQG